MPISIVLGFLVAALGLLFGVYHYVQIKKNLHTKSMLEISDVIYKTCRTYLVQQGKLLAILFIFIGAVVVFILAFGKRPSWRNVIWCGRRAAYFIMDHRWHHGFVRCGGIWHTHEHAGQCTHGICIA